MLVRVDERALIGPFLTTSRRPLPSVFSASRRCSPPDRGQRHSFCDFCDFPEEQPPGVGLADAGTGLQVGVCPESPLEGLAGRDEHRPRQWPPVGPPASPPAEQPSIASLSVSKQTLRPASARTHRRRREDRFHPSPRLTADQCLLCTSGCTSDVRSPRTLSSCVEIRSPKALEPEGSSPVTAMGMVVGARSCAQ